MSGRDAGIKTLVFVALGSSLFTSLSFYLAMIYPNTDPTRILGQIVTGVGFLGAGAIFRHDNKISGLTSAAMVWVSCALGMLSGAGLYLVPILASFTFMGLIIVLRKIETYLEKYEPPKED